MAKTTRIKGRNDRYVEVEEVGEIDQFTLTARSKSGEFAIAFGPDRPAVRTEESHLFGGYLSPTPSVGRLGNGKVWVLGSAIFVVTRVN